ncbi:MAG: hypothetical protein R3C46_15965 [Hyphomonadaceae bacterium]
MSGRIILPLLLAAAALPASAQEMSGSWAFTTGDMQPAQDCTLSGAVVIQPRIADEEKLRCRITAVYACRKQPGKKLVMEQHCSASFHRGEVWINGLDVEIIESSPVGWKQPWRPNDFLLTHNPDFTLMSGRIDTKTTASFMRVPDLAP